MLRPVSAFRFLTILALCAAASHGAPQSDSDPLPDRQVNARADPCVRLRGGASTDRVVLECLEPGTRLRLLGAISGWSHVRLLDGTEGWMDSRFLEMAPPPAAAPRPAVSTASPAGPPMDPGADLQGQIAALEGQLRAAASRNEATEERLRKTVVAAENAQREAIALRQRLEQRETPAAGADAPGRREDELAAASARVTELEAALAAAEQAGSQQAQRLEQLEVDLPAARDRETELRQRLAAAEARLRAAAKTGSDEAQHIPQLQADLAAAQDQLSAAQEASSRQARRIAELEAATPPDSPRRKELKARLRSAEKAAAEQAGRIAQLEAELAASQASEAESRQAAAAAEERLRATELFGAEQAARIDSLAAQLAEREARLAETELKERLSGREQAPSQPPAAAAVRVRAPVVSAPEPPRVKVRMPAALAGEAAAPAEPEIPATDAAINAVRAWAAAWSDQRVADYLSFYASSFRPADGLDRAAWEAQRQQRLSQPRYIKVTITSLTGELVDDGTVRATFRQEYESDSYADSVTKLLTLAEENGAWRIIDERATP